MALRITSLVVAALYALAVALQYNDPDPEVWMSYYGAGAVLSIGFAYGRLPWILPAALAAGSLAWSAWLATRVIGQKPLFAGAEGEEGREMFGLLLSAAWLAFVALRQKARAGGPRPAPAA